MSEPRDFYYIRFLEETLEQRKSLNSRYSLRAFANSLGMDVATLSNILKLKRSLPLDKAEEIANKLCTEEQRKFFISSVLKNQRYMDSIKIEKIDERLSLTEEEHDAIIDQWEHFAIFSVFTLDDFIPTLENISEKFGFEIGQTQKFLDNLIKVKLVNVENGIYSMSGKDSFFADRGITKERLLKLQLEGMQRAINIFQSVDHSLLRYGTTFYTFNHENLTQLTKLINEFQRKLASLSRQSEGKQDVYQLNLELFPVSK